MKMPGFTAEASLHQTSDLYHMVGSLDVQAGDAAVVPQQCVSTGCLELDVGRFCTNLPYIGRVCVDIPRFGGWRIRCCANWGWPPVRCRVRSC